MDKANTQVQKAGFVRKKKLQSMLERVTQEMYKRNLELAQTNKTLSLLRNIDGIALESHDTLQIVCSQVAEAIAASTDYSFVAILSNGNLRGGDLRLQGLSIDSSLAEKSKALLADFTIQSTDPWLHTLERLYIVNISKVSDSRIRNYLRCTPEEVRWIRNEASLQSIYVAKLNARQNLVGLLIVGVSHTHRSMTSADEELFDRLSEAVGVVLDSKLLFEENQRVVKQLQKTNEKLKALDQAKDEFYLFEPVRDYAYTFPA